MTIQAHAPNGTLIVEGSQQHVTKVLAARPKGGHYTISVKPTLSATKGIKYYGAYTSSSVGSDGRRVTGRKF